MGVWFLRADQKGTICKSTVSVEGFDPFIQVGIAIHQLEVEDTAFPNTKRCLGKLLLLFFVLLKNIFSLKKH